MPDETRIPVRHDADIVTARHEGREAAARIGFSGSDLTLIATAISEVARNIVAYGVEGEIVIGVVQNGERLGLEVVAQDSGPGIPNTVLALQDGYSTSRSLGLGLPGARRLMDEFELTSEVGRGTTVRMRKWRR